MPEFERFNDSMHHKIYLTKESQQIRVEIFFRNSGLKVLSELCSEFKIGDRCKKRWDVTTSFTTNKSPFAEFSLRGPYKILYETNGANGRILSIENLYQQV